MHPVHIAITIGDPNGVGPHVILLALQKIKEEGLLSQIRPIIFGDAEVINDRASRLKIDLPFYYLTPPPWPSFPPLLPEQIGFCSVTTLPTELRKEGFPSPEGGKAQKAYLDQAIVSLKSGIIEGLVTGPVNKKLISDVTGQNFLGHTGYLAEKWGFPKEQGVMIFIGNTIKVALATTHLPLKDVSAVLTEDYLCNVFKTVAWCLIEDFGLDEGRIGVLGLNPHAGEEKLMGNEEAEVIRPSILTTQKWLKRENINVQIEGPLASERGIREAIQGKYDMIIAMYHDQGILPCKVLDFGKMVNYTAGLPVVRTSVDHGVGYDILNAPINILSESMENAIKLASIIAHRRRSHKRL